MAKTVVVYHSGYGHTQRVAQQVADGANAQLLAIDAEGNLPEGGWETLNAADAIIFGTPTRLSTSSMPVAANPFSVSTSSPARTSSSRVSSVSSGRFGGRPRLRGGECCSSMCKY